MTKYFMFVASVITLALVVLPAQADVNLCQQLTARYMRIAALEAQLELRFNQSVRTEARQPVDGVLAAARDKRDQIAESLKKTCPIVEFKMSDLDEPIKKLQDQGVVIPY
jgi:hypothetical protein